MPVIVHDFEVVAETPEPRPPTPSELPAPPPAPPLRPADLRLVLHREAQRAARVRAH